MVTITNRMLYDKIEAIEKKLSYVTVFKWMSATSLAMSFMIISKMWGI